MNRYGPADNSNAVSDTVPGHDGLCWGGDMKSGDVERDWFAILSDDGQMIGGASVFDRKRVVVSAAGSYSDAEPLPVVTPEMRSFAEAEARRLGLIDG